MRPAALMTLVLGMACGDAPAATYPPDYVAAAHANMSRPAELYVVEGELREPVLSERLHKRPRKYRGLTLTPAQEDWVYRYRYLRGSVILSSAGGMGGGLFLMGTGAFLEAVTDEGWCLGLESPNCVETPSNLAIAGGAFLVAGLVGTTVSAIFLHRHKRQMPGGLALTPGGLRFRF